MEFSDISKIHLNFTTFSTENQRKANEISVIFSNTHTQKENLLNQQISSAGIGTNDFFLQYLQIFLLDLQIFCKFNRWICTLYRKVFTLIQKKICCPADDICWFNRFFFLREKGFRWLKFWKMTLIKNLILQSLTCQNCLLKYFLTK